ncbi:hypothetical protein EK0264_09610 [Epidermidibacterium keratini]|uniref:DUF732 domain-containing protein n=1 Tax=Epidermidibacterium keratini TaxID=1891644 RepID=A0A7L4YNP5_9ACTN|nr:hypothetical protein [Epidermidibacterium keratini]QHC00513.1 hypothetical protein EK0264_09610 [Epidermidibacterium keratini]
MTNKMALRRMVGASMIGLSAFGLAACGGGKPSEGDLNDKLAGLYEDGAGLDSETAGKLADCMSPKLIDSMSEDGLQAIMDAESSDVINNSGEKISQEDNDALTKAGTDCASEMGITPGS